MKGYIDVVNKDTVRGWAKLTSSSNPCNVSLFYNDKKIASAKANLFRKGLIDKGIHKTGKCGFVFEITKYDLPFSNEDKVSVEIEKEGQRIQLQNSPYYIKKDIIKEPIGSGTIRGYIDEITEDQIIGWVSIGFHSDPVEIFLNIDGNRGLSTLANIYKPSIKQLKIHATGNCGFVINLKENNLILPPSCIIHLSLIENGKDIPIGSSRQIFNSPHFIEEKQLSFQKLKHPEGHEPTFITGLSKTGTSIITYKIAESIPDSHIVFEPAGNEGLRRITIHEDILKKYNSPITKSLIVDPSKDLLQVIPLLYKKKIMIIRDPRDRVISSFFYHWFYGHNPDTYSFETAYNLTKQKEQNPMEVNFIDLLHTRSNLNSFLQYEKNLYEKLSSIVSHLDKSWFILKYEDFIDEKYTELSNYLNFKIQDSNTTVNPKFKRVERSKTYGNWRNWFTKKDVEVLKPIYNDFLEDMGYDKMDWNYNEMKSLPPAQGSEYMKKVNTKK